MRRGHSSARSKRTSFATRSTPRAINMCSSVWPERRKQSLAGASASVTPKARWISCTTSAAASSAVAIRDAFGDSASHGVIVKTYSVTHLVKEAQGRYSPAAVVKVEREVVTGDPDQYVSTSYVERQNLSLRMGQRRFTRLTNGFSKKIDNHVAAVALYVAHYNLCRVHEALKTTPAKALGVVDRNWSIGELIDAALATQPIAPVTSAPDRRKLFKVVQGGKA